MARSKDSNKSSKGGSSKSGVNPSNFRHEKPSLSTLDGSPVPMVAITNRQQRSLTKGDDDSSIPSNASELPHSGSTPTMPSTTGTAGGAVSSAQLANYVKFGTDKTVDLCDIYGTQQAIKDLDMQDLVDPLTTYCKLHHTQPSTHPLHSPERIFGITWDFLPSSIRLDFIDAVQDHYFTLTTDNHILFAPVVKEAKTLLPSHSSQTSANCTRMKLVSLCSSEIPMSGTKLSMSTTPMELGIFSDSLLRQVDQRPNWNRIITMRLIATKHGSSKKKLTFHIVNDFRKISQDQILKYDFHSGSLKKDASISLYEALSATMSSQFRGEMRLYKESINNQGPKLLWFILKRLTLHHDRVKANVVDELHTLSTVLESIKFDVHKLCPILHSRLMDYRDAGGDVDSHYELISNTFTNINIDSFTSKIREWEQRKVLSSGTKCIFELLQEIPLMVDSLININQWPHKVLGRPTLANHLPKVSKKRKSADIEKESSPDITAFVTSATDCISKLSKSISANAASAASGGGKDPTKNKRQKFNKERTNYHYCSDRWGGSKNHYKNEEDFKKFFNGENICKSTVYNLDGDKWFWCEHCGRMGNHSTARHRKRRGDKSTSSSAGAAPPPAANLSALPPPAVDSNSHIGNTSSFDADTIKDATSALASDSETSDSDSS